MNKVFLFCIMIRKGLRLLLCFGVIPMASFFS